MDTKRTKAKLGERLSTSQTDWDRVDKLSDADIDCSDIPELGEEFFRNAKVLRPPGKEQ